MVLGDLSRRLSERQPPLRPAWGEPMEPAGVTVEHDPATGIYTTTAAWTSGRRAEELRWEQGGPVLDFSPIFNLADPADAQE